MSNTQAVLAYDLTTPEGLSKALVEYAKQHPVQSAALLAILAPTVGPAALAGLFLGKTMEETVRKFWGRSEKVIEAQRKAAISVIQEGKASGAKKVRVTMNQKAGIDIGGALEGYSLKFSVGTDDQMTIEAEFA